MTHTEDQNERFLALTGVIIESEYNVNILSGELESIKRRFFQKDPEIPVILHRADMINCRPPFEALRDPILKDQFNAAILDALRRWRFHVITVLIDKRAHREQYVVWRHHPYHYCLEVLLERFVLFLHYGNYRGDVMVESRGRFEDQKLMDSFRRLYENGTDHIPAERWQARLTSKELKVKPKTANSAGLQLADILAHPSRREVLLDHKLIDDSREIFANLICEILREEKYLKSQQGRIEGYGKKILP